ncbi:hypothetical protein G6514_002608 [Epicoccum nigrum]|nr:hypothetical protein G6514_002608 [Epicoccum nigrum]
MGIPLWPGKAARWPGSHLPRHQWPRGMHLDEAGNPIYPPGVTCKQLGEEPVYFPVNFLFWIFAVLSVLLYLVWPAYVMWRFLRTSADETVERADGPHANFEDAHDDFVAGGNKGNGAERENDIDS